MRTCRRALVALPIVCLLVMHPALAQTLASSEPIDYNAIYTIKDEGFQRSQVMETVSYLTDVYGPRLTGGHAARAQADRTAAGSPANHFHDDEGRRRTDRRAATA